MNTCKKNCSFILMTCIYMFTFFFFLSSPSCHCFRQQVIALVNCKAPFRQVSVLTDAAGQWLPGFPFLKDEIFLLVFTKLHLVQNYGALFSATLTLKNPHAILNSNGAIKILEKRNKTSDHTLSPQLFPSTTCHNFYMHCFFASKVHFQILLLVLAQLGSQQHYLYTDIFQRAACSTQLMEKVAQLQERT